MTPQPILQALKKSTRGVRCCVAHPPSYHLENCQGPARGITGTLKLSGIQGHLMFTSDGLHRVHFKWREWQGLHIPSLGIYRA
jgi:hypothetical protein